MSKFSIYGHIKMHRRPRFVVQDSPSPSPDPQEDAFQPFTAHPPPSPPPSNQTGNHIASGEVSRECSGSLLEPKLHLASVTQHAFSDSGQARHFSHEDVAVPALMRSRASTAEEAVEVDASGEIDTEFPDIITKRRAARPPTAPPEDSAIPRQEYSADYRGYYLKLRRSLRGRFLTGPRYDRSFPLPPGMQDQYLQPLEPDEIFGEASEPSIDTMPPKQGGPRVKTRNRCKLFTNESKRFRNNIRQLLEQSLPQAKF